MSRFDTEGDVNLSNRRAAWQAEHLGSETQALLDRDAEVFLHQSLSTPCLNALERAEGAWLIDLEGRRYLDFHGNSVHQLGHGHPTVVAAVKAAMDELPFCPRRYTNRYAVELARQLGEYAPGTLNKVLFAPGGTAAIGMALKLARMATGRFKTVSMWDSFHGASLDAISVGGEAQFRSRVGPLLPGTEHVPPPDPIRCPLGCGSACSLACAGYLEYVLEREGDVAAVVAEPMRCTTVVVPPADYWPRIRAACDRHGALLIFDEIPIGLGRTGHLFASELTGVVPDMLVLGKGLGGGIFPMAALLARHDLDVAGDVALGHYTHEKSPLGAAAGLATLDVLREENLLARSRQLGERLVSAMRRVQDEVATIREVRGIGLLVGVEMYASEVAEAVMYEALSRGLSFKVSSGTVLTLTPPLTLTDEELDQSIEILSASIHAVSKG